MICSGGITPDGLSTMICSMSSAARKGRRQLPPVFPSSPARTRWYVVSLLYWNALLDLESVHPAQDG